MRNNQNKTPQIPYYFKFEYSQIISEICQLDNLEKLKNKNSVNIFNRVVSIWISKFFEIFRNCFSFYYYSETVHYDQIYIIFSNSEMATYLYNYIEFTIGLFEFLMYLWKVIVITEKLEIVGDILCSRKMYHIDENYIPKIDSFVYILKFFMDI